MQQHTVGYEYADAHQADPGPDCDRKLHDAELTGRARHVNDYTQAERLEQYSMLFVVLFKLVGEPVYVFLIKFNNIECLLFHFSLPKLL